MGLEKTGTLRPGLCPPGKHLRSKVCDVGSLSAVGWCPLLRCLTTQEDLYIKG